MIRIESKSVAKVLRPLAQVRMLGLHVRVEVVLLRKRLSAKLAAEVEALDVNVDDVIAKLGLRVENLFAEVATLADVRVLGGLSGRSLRQVFYDDGQRVVGVDRALVLTLFILHGLDSFPLDRLGELSLCRDFGPIFFRRVCS